MLNFFRPKPFSAKDLQQLSSKEDEIETRIKKSVIECNKLHCSRLDIFANEEDLQMIRDIVDKWEGFTLREYKVSEQNFWYTFVHHSLCLATLNVKRGDGEFMKLRLSW